jgi:hypothetical protein
MAVKGGNGGSNGGCNTGDGGEHGLITAAAIGWLCWQCCGMTIVA